MCSNCVQKNDWTATFHNGSSIGSGDMQRQYIGGTTQGATGLALVDGLISGLRWDGLTITYNFPVIASLYGSIENYGDNAPASGFSQFTADMRSDVNAIFTTISSFTNATFTAVADTTPGSRVDIAFGQTTTTGTGFAYNPGSSSLSGDVWVANSQYNNPGVGNYEYLTFMHEVGHALGLKHGHEAGGIAGAVQTNRDSMEFTVMTYRSYIGDTPSGYANESNGYAQSYMMLDIAALQAMYGADYTTNASNSVYSFNATTGAMLINGVSQVDPEGSKIFRTIWDGGGVDTYDYSTYTNNQDISLAAGRWSMFSTAQLANLGDGNTARANVYNSMLFNDDTRSLIENATAGAGNDHVEGNQIANTLLGNAGADILVGQGGNDILVGGIGNDKLYGDFEPVAAAPAPVAPPYTLGTSYATLGTGITRNSTATAFDLSDKFSFVADADIANATTFAHSTVNATANGGADWYKVTLNAGNRLIVDIDNSFANYDSYIHIVSSDGTTIVGGNDDAISSELDAGSTVTTDSHVIYSPTTSGTYYIVIDSYRATQTLATANISSGKTYELNVSIDVTPPVSDLPGPLGVAGNDTLTGGAGNDRFVLSAGFDTITDFTAGGTEDAIDISALTGLSSVDLGKSLAVQSGADVVITFAFNNVLTLSNVNVEALTASDFIQAATGSSNVINDTAASNSLTGTLGVDTIYGNAGNDVLSGLAGNDTLLGGDGADYLYGNNDNDLLDGGADNDVLLAGDGDDTVVGGSGIDYVFGGTGSNVLSGGAGLDILISEGANDVMNGGADQNFYYRQTNGASQIFGGDGLDILVGGTFASDDVFFGLGGGDFALGGAGNDELNGGLGDDILLSGDGNDTLDGGLGLNYLYADGVGNDLVRIDTALGSSQIQLLIDFAAGGTDDVLQLSGSRLSSFEGYQSLLSSLGTAINGNLLQNTGVGAVLTLNLGATNQTDIWFLGISAYSLTATDFQFI
jgi:serralysin